MEEIAYLYVKNKYENVFEFHHYQYRLKIIKSFNRSTIFRHRISHTTLQIGISFCDFFFLLFGFTNKTVCVLLSAI